MKTIVLLNDGSCGCGGSFYDGTYSVPDDTDFDAVRDRWTWWYHHVYVPEHRNNEKPHCIHMPEWVVTKEGWVKLDVEELEY